MLGLGVGACSSPAPAAPTVSTAPTAASVSSAPAAATVSAPPTSASVSAAPTNAASVSADPTPASPTQPPPSGVQGAVASDPSPSPAAAGAVSGDAARGKALFVDKSCAACHGNNAQGQFGPALRGTPRTFRQVLFQVRHGGGGMPEFTSDDASDAEVMDIYAYLRSLDS